MRDIGMVGRRTLERMQRKGDALEGEGTGVKETDNVAPACLCQHNSMIISAHRCVCRCAYLFLCCLAYMRVSRCERADK